MLLKKMITAKVPSVQYGNVDFQVGIEHEFEVSGTPQDILKTIRTEGVVVDKALQMEYSKFYSAFAEDEQMVEKLTSI